MCRIMYMNFCILILKGRVGIRCVFAEEELKVDEELTWKMLDELNHAYMSNLKDYAHFY